MAYISNFFQLNDEYADQLFNWKPKFGYDMFGEAVYYRTYSRIKHDGSNEDWNDTVLRVVNGTFSIRRDWYIKAGIPWDDKKWQDYALKFAKSMFNMKWLPPGRGLWAMGTQFIVDRGSMALYNCAYTRLGGRERLANDFEWLMDCLMCGVGVGFYAERDDHLKVNVNRKWNKFSYQIPDTREGWCHSTKLLLEAYLLGHSKPIFDYSLVRPAGLPIKGFGGISSGPEPLIELHKFIEYTFENHVDSVRIKTDIANMIGKCVVAGNVRRSAEIGLGTMNDPVFKDLKNYEIYPERAGFGYLSNNSIMLKDIEDYGQLGEIADRVITRGEPGLVNLRNFPFARIGKKMKDLREDEAEGINPCGEVQLYDKETCNVVETAPTNCETEEEWYEACEHATFYASTVSLLPTHRSETNAIVVKNRRIGVSIMDYTNWVKRDKQYSVIRQLREGYKIVRRVNNQMNDEAGVPRSIRVTTVKPGGTVPKLVGVVSGAGYPTFNHTLRRMSVAKNHPICRVFDKAGVPFQVKQFEPETLLYEFPIIQQGTPAMAVSLWEQAANLVTLQREWADNSVSNTLYFRPKWRVVAIYDSYDKAKCHFDEPVNQRWDDGPLFDSYDWEKSTTARIIEKWGKFQVQIFDPQHEEDIVEKVLSTIVPVIKSASLLPHSAVGVYQQMPEEGITEAEYLRRKTQISSFDWSLLSGSDGQDEKYCSGGVCETVHSN